MKNEKIVKTKNGYVWIDTCQLTDVVGNMLDTMGFGNPDAVAGEYETMVFKCDKSGKVKDWGEIAKDNYETEKEAKKGHLKMIKRFEKGTKI